MHRLKITIYFHTFVLNDNYIAAAVKISIHLAYSAPEVPFCHTFRKCTLLSILKQGGTFGSNREGSPSGSMHCEKVIVWRLVRSYDYHKVNQHQGVIAKAHTDFRLKSGL